MDRLQIAQHHDRLSQIIRDVQRVGALIILVSLCGYGLSAWLLFENQPWGAVLVATSSFLLFRTWRTMPLIISRQLRAKQDDYAATFQLLNEAIAQSDTSTVLNRIHENLKEIA